MRARAILAASLAAGAASLSLQASPLLAGNIWDGGGGNNDWSTNNNWSPDGDPLNNGTENVTFAGVTRLTPNLNSSWSILSLTFQNDAGAFSLNTSAGRTLTIGAGGIAQNDADTQTITHALTLGASQNWNSASGALVVSGAISLGANTLTATTTAATATTYSGSISGTGALTKSGANTLLLSGAAANTYSGLTTVNAGTLLLGKTVSNGAIAGSLTIGDASGTDTATLAASNQIADAATVTLTSSGVFDLQTFSETIANVTMTGGQVTGTTGTLALSGTLTHNASAASATIQNVSLQLTGGNKTFTVADGAAAIDLDIGSAITQDVAGRSLTKGGAGTLRLSGTNTFSGGLTHSAGTLILANDAAAGTGTFTVAGGVTVKPEGARTLTNAVNLSGGVATISADSMADSIALNGVVSGVGGITAQGAGAFKLSGANSFSGGFTHSGTGLVDIGTSSALGTGTVTTAAGSTRAFTTTVDGHVTVANNFVLNGPAQFAFTGTNGMTLSGAISGPGGLNVPDGPLTLSGAGNSYAGVTNVGDGVNFTSLRVFADSALGATSAATVVLPNATLSIGATYLTPEPLTVSGLGLDNVGAVFLSNTGTTFAGPISLAADAMITASVNSTRYSGAISTNSFALTIRGNSLAGSGFGTVAAPITGGGSVTVEQSIVFENANNTYAGSTTVTGALRTVGVGFDNIPDASTVTLPNITSAALRLDGGDIETVGSLAGGGTSGGNVELIADAHLTAGGNNDSTTFAGAISDPSFVTGGKLTKAGSGTMTLAGANTYRGATTVNGGVLRLTGGAAVSDLSAVTLVDSPGVALDVQASETIGGLSGGGPSGGNVVLGSGVTLTVAGGGTFAGTISGASAAGVSKSGAGTLVLSGANTFAGTLAVNAGTLRAQGGAAIGDSVPVTTANVVGAILDVGNSETIGGLSGGGGSGGNVTLSGGSLTIAGGGTFGGVVSGGFGVTKTSGADLVLTGVNTFTGKVNVNSGGRLGVNADSGLGAVPGVFTADAVTLDNGTLQANAASLSIPANRGITIGAGGATLRGINSSVMTVASKLTGSANLTIATNGSPATPAIVTLSGLNTTFTGNTTVDGAVLGVTQDANLSAAPGVFAPDKLTLTNGGALKASGSFSLPANRGITISNGVGTGGVLDVDVANTLTVLAPLSGAGNLTKRGTGTLVLSNSASTLSGRTIIDGGLLTAAQDANFGAAPGGLVSDQLTINAASLRWTSTSGVAATRGIRLGSPSSTINIDPGVTMTVNAPVNGPGGLTKTGSGTLSLVGTNTYAGSTSVGSGRVVLNSSFTSAASIAVSAGGTLELAEVSVATVKATSITSVGKFDVKNDKLILTAQPVGSWNGSAYTGLSGMIQTGFAGGLWSGNGLTTTMPDAQDGLTSLGIATAEQTGRVGGTFGGLSVGAGNVLVMYTYMGDANLDGFISGDDYAAIDFNIAVPNARGWVNGDFNYDGVISGDDYSAIDFNIIAQGAPFPTGATAASSLSGVTAVPEPTAAGLIALTALAGSLARRRRR